MINVLLADDSGFMRLMITDILSSDQNIQVVSTAENGKDAYEKVLKYNPDVVVMDITMPDYDGLYGVDEIMAKAPKPIIMLSALGNTQPSAVFDAINRGAFDFINKPEGVFSSNIREINTKLINKVIEASKADIQKLKKTRLSANTNRHSFDSKLAYDCLVIGSSTGGTGAIEEILKQMPENLPLPILIAQHMPSDFITSFARRLNELYPFQVKVAVQGEIIKSGTVYVASGDYNMKIAKNDQGYNVIDYTLKKFTEFNYPSVDCLMESASEVYGNRAIAVILTGMGRDGASGMKLLKEKGALTIAQDEKSSVVWGMPKAAIDNNAINHIIPITQISGFVVSAIS